MSTATATHHATPIRTATDIRKARITTAIFNGDDAYEVDVEFTCKDKGTRIAHFANDPVGASCGSHAPRFVKHMYIADPPVFAVVSATATNGERLPLTSFAIHDITYQLTHKYANNAAYFTTIDGDTDCVVEID